jgi:hypothetical protein
MPRSPRFLEKLAALLALLSTAGFVPARAQCLISGPTTLCPGSTIQLCGPANSNAMYWWQAPDGSAYLSQCVTVSMTGRWALSINDWTTNTTDTCSVNVTSGVAAAPAIDGPASACTGATVSWCGPAGSYEYAWSGPNGFASSTACVDLGAAGDYSLRVRALPDGCWGDSTTRTLAVAACSSSTGVNCPRSAAWWERQLGHVAGAAVAPSLAQLASCVDDHDVFFAWTSPVDGLREVLGAQRRTLRMSAARQVAAVWANVCASPSGVTTESAAAITLDPSTPLTLPGASGTVGDWLVAADAELASLATQRDHAPAVKAAYRRLVITGWHINHGLGIGATCDSAALGEHEGGSRHAMASVIGFGDAEPLAGELIDETSGSLEFGELSPNPFSSATTLAFAVSTDAPAAVTVGVYDVSGRLVRELVRGTFAPGRYVTSWDGRSSEGSPAKSGSYFILGRIGGERAQTRVALVH